MCVCVSVCLSVCPSFKMSGTKCRIAVFLCRCEEILLASCTNCFLNLHDTWLERRSLWNFLAGYALEPVHARYTSGYLGKMNLAHRLNAAGTFSKFTGTIVDILESYALKDTLVNELQRKKDMRP